MLMISNFFLIFIKVCVIVSFLTRFLTFGILYSTAVNAEAVAKPIILGILVLTSFIFKLRIAL